MLVVSPAVDGSVLIVAGRECTVVIGSVPRPIFGDGRFFSTLLLPMSLVSKSTACVCRFLPACAESRKNSSVMSRVESLLHGSRSWLLRCNAMTDVVPIQTVHKVLRRENI